MAVSYEDDYYFGMILMGIGAGIASGSFFGLLLGIATGLGTCGLALFMGAFFR